jgi:hypothetical protein
MKRLALALIAACAGCAEPPPPPRLAEVEQECGYTRKQFVEAWPCISVGYAYPGDDIRAAYIAKGNYAAEQVREGRMGEAEARMLMADAYQHALSTYRSRQAASTMASGGPPVVIPTASQSTYQMPLPPIRQPVNCFPVGNTVQCY